MDKIPDTLKEDGYPDVQVFMRTFREMESVVEQYNRDLAEWEYQASRQKSRNILACFTCFFENIILSPVQFICQIE